MFQHGYLDTYCFECLICMRFVFLYLHLFIAIEHVLHMERRSRNTPIIIIMIVFKFGTVQADSPLFSATWRENQFYCSDFDLSINHHGVTVAVDWA